MHFFTFPFLYMSGAAATIQSPTLAPATTGTPTTALPSSLGICVLCLIGIHAYGHSLIPFSYSLQ